MAEQTEASVKHADPYKEANADEDVPLDQKVQDLSNFMTHCKFGMMTTRDAGSGNLVSRCMALAAQVRNPPQPRKQQSDCPPNQTLYRKAAASTSCSTQTPSRARRLTLPAIRTSTSASSTTRVTGHR